jgi:mono/diheme cytochrome c family protein
MMALAGLTMTGAAVLAQQDKAKVEAGVEVYNNYCFTCHGENLVSSGQTFDLRRLKSTDRKRFDTAVQNGKGQMPPWKGVLEEAQIDAVWAYIRANSKEP